jgi:hypothetical protein
MDLVPATCTVMCRGDEYGRYFVLGIFQQKDGYEKYALVKCSCGSDERFVKVGTLRSGESQSCGCLHKERVTTHGAWGHPIFNVWSMMMKRCYNKKDKRYSRYGGRGILVCKRWHNVNNFIADMHPSYEEGKSIDRKNNDKGYSPENCRWASQKQQNRNYSRNVILEYDGKSMCIKEWSEETGINYGTLWDRLKQGWSTERALTIPVKSK